MAVAARTAGVTRLVDMVMLVSAPDAPTPRLRENYLSEQVFESAGGRGSPRESDGVLRERPCSCPGELGDRHGRVQGAVRQRQHCDPPGRRKGRGTVAVGALTAAEAPVGTAYPVVGQVLTVREIAATLARGFGREITYQNISDETWLEAVGTRINDHAATHLSKLWAVPRDFNGERTGLCGHRHHRERGRPRTEDACGVRGRGRLS
ncbi:hypothetical protein GCM10027569_86280 [Flindersiella endophytica]